MAIASAAVREFIHEACFAVAAVADQRGSLHYAFVVAEVLATLRSAPARQTMQRSLSRWDDTHALVGFTTVKPPDVESLDLLLAKVTLRGRESLYVRIYI